MHLVLGLAALVVIPLAQVPLVVVLSRYVELGEDEELPRPGRGYVTYGTESARPDVVDGDPVCPTCGAAFDGDFEHCGQCAGRLPTGPA